MAVETGPTVYFGASHAQMYVAIVLVFNAFRHSVCAVSTHERSQC